MDDGVRVAKQAGAEGGLPPVLTELRQWHVFRVAAAYAVGAWLVVQVVATIGPAFDLPGWVLRAVVLAAIVGFLATMAFLLFRPRRGGKGRVQKYLSGRARMIAAAGVLLIAAGAAVLSIRSLSAREQVSLAVLPFADLSPARDKAYFAEGVAEEILSTLAAEKGIKVLGRSSARQLERNPDPKVVRASLGVTHLLEGSTRTAGDNLRVNVRLIDTSDGSQLWEEEYQGRLADVFSVQDQIAGTVVKRLRGTILERDVRTAEATNIDAYETYLAARALMRTRSKPTLEKAMELAGKVIAADPNYAPGHAIYAELHYMLSDDASAYGDIPLERARALALPHAKKAIQLAPEKAEGYAALGLILPRSQSIEPLKRAIALDPGRAELRVWLGLALGELARHDEAYEQIAAAAEAEPLWPVAINRLTQALATSGRGREALAAVRKFRDRGGQPQHVYRFLATIARARSDLSRSARYDLAAYRADKTTPYVSAWLARIYSLLGMDEQAIQAWPHPTPYGRLFIAGRRDELLQKARTDRPQVFWRDPDLDYALFALGSARDWPRVVQLYRARTPRFLDYCNADPHGAPLIIMALRVTDDVRGSEELHDCGSQRVERELAMTWDSANAEPGRLEFRKASLLGAVGDARGMDWLVKAVQRGWVGQYYSSRLSDWPQFDVFRADRRYPILQKRIDATITRERAELLAGR